MRIRSLAGALTLVAATSCAASAHGATIVVDHAGTDGATCGVAPAPNCKTIAYAVETRANDGDVVSIVPSATPYAEGDIATTESVSIVGAGPGVILTGDAVGTTPTLRLDPAARVTVSQLTFRSSVQQQIGELVVTGPVDVSDVRFDSPQAVIDRWQAEIAASPAGAPTLRRAVFAGSSLEKGKALIVQGVSKAVPAVVDDVTVQDGYGDRFGPGGGADGYVDVVAFERGVVADDVDITANGRSGLTVVGAVSLSNSRIVVGAQDADTAIVASKVRLYPPGGPVEAYFPEVTLRGNEVRGTVFGLSSSADDSAPQWDLQRNLVVARTTGILVRSLAALTSTHDTIVGDLSGVSVQTGATASLARTFASTVVGTGTCASTQSAGTGCGMTPIADPGFVNPAGGDHRLAAGSALIDAGIPTDPLVEEFDGDANGSITSDVGYDEFRPTPDTLIQSAPGAVASGQTATFTFGSPTGGATFTCTLDLGPAVPCDVGSFTTPALSAGAHTFSVAASVAGNTDPTPATSTLTVEAPPAAPGVPGALPAGGGTPPPAGGQGVERMVLSRLSLTAKRLKAGRVRRTAALTFTASAPGTVTARLVRVLARGRTKRVGKAAGIRVTKAGSARVRLDRFAKRLPRGRYRVELTVGSRTVRSGVLTVTARRP